MLERLLTPKGLLFVGPSETGVFLSHGFVSAKVPLAFAFRKGRAVARRRCQAAAASGPTRPAPIACCEPRSRARAAGDGRHPEPTRSRLATAASSEAVKLADQGHFAEAARCCEEHLRRHGPSAEAFHLLGLVRDALGNATDAATYYRKALYLDPDHHEALDPSRAADGEAGQKSEAAGAVEPRAAVGHAKGALT